MSNPIDDYLGSKTKTAAFQLPLPGMGRMGGRELAMRAMQGAAPVLGGAAALGIAGAAGKVYDAIAKQRAFNTLLAANPDLAEHQTGDPAVFNRFYDSLHMTSPRYARDPVIAGTWMRTMLRAPESAGSVAENAGKSGPDVSLSSKFGPLSLKYSY